MTGVHSGTELFFNVLSENSEIGLIHIIISVIVHSALYLTHFKLHPLQNARSSHFVLFGLLIFFGFEMIFGTETNKKINFYSAYNADYFLLCPFLTIQSVYSHHENRLEQRKKTTFIRFHFKLHFKKVIIKCKWIPWVCPYVCIMLNHERIIIKSTLLMQTVHNKDGWMLNKNLISLIEEKQTSVGVQIQWICIN